MHINTTLMLAFERGEINKADEIRLFSELVRTGMAWRLQGFYARHAQYMIEEGLIDEKGRVLQEG